MYSTLEPSNGRNNINSYDVNTFVTHPWIAVEEETNDVMLLNFRKIYYPVVPEIRRIEAENRNVFVRKEVVITPYPNGKATCREIIFHRFADFSV